MVITSTIRVSPIHVLAGDQSIEICTVLAFEV